MKRLKLLCILLATLMLSAVFASCASSDRQNLKCTISVDCSAVAEKMDEAIAPADGKYILPPTQASFGAGETLDSILISAFKAEKLHYEADDGYFIGIGNLYTGDFGEMSGWLYYVNGELPESGTKDYAVCDGDVIEFVYFEDFNKAFEN